jgi:hypothetical protein
MNIEKTYAEKMLAILEEYKKIGQVNSNTFGHAIEGKDGAVINRAGFGGCGGFMSLLYSSGGARNYWSMPTPTLMEKKGVSAKISEKDIESLFKLWLQMVSELFIPIKYVGLMDLKDAQKLMCKQTKDRANMGSIPSLYARTFVTEHYSVNYAHAAHFKMAHTALRYMFRYEMQDAFYHTVKMKLLNPTISMLDCLVTASYFCKLYYSPMMLFRWFKDNVTFKQQYQKSPGIVDCSFPIPRLRGQIMRQIINNKAESKTESITSFFTEVVRLKGKEENAKLLIKCQTDINIKATKADYLNALKALRTIAVEYRANKTAAILS